LPVGIACCLLPIACIACIAYIAYCLLPIAYVVYCLLSVAYCLLPIVYCLPAVKRRVHTSEKRKQRKKNFYEQRRRTRHATRKMPGSRLAQATGPFYTSQLAL
jgi:hypothetical protein